MILIQVERLIQYFCRRTDFLRSSEVEVCLFALLSGSRCLANKRRFSDLDPGTVFDTR